MWLINPGLKIKKQNKTKHTEKPLVSWKKEEYYYKTHRY